MNTEPHGLTSFRPLAAAVLVMMALAGCSMYRAAIAERGAEASDAALESTVWTMCKGMPVGAVTRKFNTPQLRAAYNTICSAELP